MSVSNSAPQTGPYAVKIKHGGPWRRFDTVRLEISVGQPYHEGDKFACTIDWAMERFDRIALLVNDTLQRHNLMFEHGLSEDEAHAESFKAGSDWIERNHQAIVRSRAEIFRWDDWLKGAKYPRIRHGVELLYQRNAEFRSAIDATAAKIWARHLAREPGLTLREEEFLDRSRAYLLEETAAFAIIYDTIPGISVYPGSFGEAWSIFIDRDVPGAPEGLKNGHVMRIDFERRKAA